MTHRPGILALCLVGAAAALPACRIEPAEPYWIEAHGRGEMSAIAASPRGVEGVGTSSGVYRYPGEYGVSWKSLVKARAKAVGASPKGTYVLDQGGVVSLVRPDGRTTAWSHSASWQVTAVTADEEDVVYVVAARRAMRVSGTSLEPIACDGPAVALAATTRAVYVVSPEGVLDVAEGGGCRPVDVPGTVRSVTAFGERLAIAGPRGAFERRGGKWQRLPDPVRYRETGKKVMEVVEVAVSRNSLWARDGAGDVFVLWEPS